MPETIKSGCDGEQKWHWCDVMGDLDRQGGLAGVIVDPFTVSNGCCAGQTMVGTKFSITWARDMFLFLSMSQEEDALIEAFAKVVGYRPFCRYVSGNGLLTFEWDKKDPKGQFAELQKQGMTKLEKVQ